MRKNINATMLDLLEYIRDFQQEKGFFPTVREMASYLDVKSTCTVKYYLDKLCDLGIISKVNQKSRAINFLIKDDKWRSILNVHSAPTKKYSYKNTSSFYHEDTIDIPIVGNVAAGQPILAVEEYEEKWKLPYEMFNKSNLFILNVHGDSMINAGIFDGDKIVVCQQNTADNGEIIVAMVDESVTVKRFYKEKNRIRLQPENDTMDPMYFDDVKILGKVIGLIRNI